jgi:hypothetical protein
MILIPFPEEPRDPLLAEIIAGMERKTITDMTAYSARVRFLMRKAAKEAMRVEPNDVTLMTEWGVVGPGFSTKGAGLNWSLGIGRDAPEDEELMGWCDPYRHGLDLLRARATKDYGRADEIRAAIIAYYHAEVRLVPEGLLITTAEKGFY